MSSINEYIPEVAKKEAEVLADEDADSTNSSLRYFAYGSRLQTVLRASSRYIAYVRPARTTPMIPVNEVSARLVTLARPFGRSSVYLVTQAM